MLYQKKHYKQMLKPSYLMAACMIISVLPGCSWDDSLYKEFVDADGNLSICTGRCKNEHIVVKEDCKGDYKIWVEQAKDGVASSSSSGYCFVKREQECVELSQKYKDLSWNSLDFQMLELGNGQYIRFIAKEGYPPQNTPGERKNLDGDYICGTFDEMKAFGVSKEPIFEQYRCSDESIKAMKKSFEGRICPVAANQCNYFEELVNLNPSATSQNVGFCSKCDLNQVMCGKECVNLQIDPEHCGSCQNNCGEDYVCNQGKCQKTCEDNAILCENANKKYCLRQDVDATCGATCDKDGETCDGVTTRCTLNKETKQYACMALCKNKIPCYKTTESGMQVLTCLDPASDTTCGATDCDESKIKDKECSVDKSCVKNPAGNYECGCESGEIKDENGNCFLPSLVYSCGKSKIDCTALVSQEEKERVTCSPSETENEYECHCKKAFFEPTSEDGNLRCADTKTDNQYCGDERVTCSKDKVCIDGKCVCDNGKVLCNNTCIDPSSDRYNCGASGLCNSSLSTSKDYQGETCGAKTTCEGGVCRCKPDFVPYENDCLDPDAAKSCGAYVGTSKGDIFIGTDCTAIGAIACSDGKCICPTSTAQSKWVLMTKEDGNRQCIDIWNDPDYCGSEDGKKHQCKQTESCFNGECVPYTERPCSDGKIRCGRACLDPDDKHVRYDSSNSCSCQEGYCPLSSSYEEGCPIRIHSDQACASCPVYNNDNGVLTNPGVDCTKETDTTECVQSEDKSYRCACPGSNQKNIHYCSFEIDGKNVDICTDFDEYHIRWRDLDVPEEKFVGQCTNSKGSNNNAVGVICMDGYADCDNDMSNGCEMSLKDNVKNCGQCGNECQDYSNAYPACQDGICKIGECKAEYTTCSPNNECGTKIDNILHDEFGDNALCGGCNKRKDKCGDKQSCRNQTCCYDNQVITSRKIKNGCCDPAAVVYRKCSVQFIGCLDYDYQCALESPGDGWKKY